LYSISPFSRPLFTISHIGVLSSIKVYQQSSLLLSPISVNHFSSLPDSSYQTETRTALTVSDFTKLEYESLFNASFKSTYNLSTGGVNFNYNSLSSGFLSTLCVLILGSQSVVEALSSTNSLNLSTTVSSFHMKLLLNLSYLPRDNGDKFAYSLCKSFSTFEDMMLHIVSIETHLQSSDFE